jgi:hypothetical protein
MRNRAPPQKFLSIPGSGYQFALHASERTRTKFFDRVRMNLSESSLLSSLPVDVQQ